MTRRLLARRAARAAAGLLLAVGGCWATGGTANAAAGKRGTPLAVTIETLSPSTVPTDPADPVTVTGEVVNASEETWTDLRVYLVTSAEPLTTPEQLATATATDPATEIGPRVTRRGRYATVPDLAPDQSAPYTLTVPRRDLPISGAPGVYWLAVHVLGGAGGARDAVADGRARSFLPLMEPDGPTAGLSLVVPIKAGVNRMRDGSLQSAAHWERLVSRGGRLNRLLRLGGTAPLGGLTWLVDPAVLDAVDSLAAGNPAAGPGDVAPSDGGPDDEPVPRAVQWLDRFDRQAGRAAVLHLPYGDLDVAAALRHRYRGLYQSAMDLSVATMTGRGVASSSVVAPPSRLLPPIAVPRVGADADVPLLISRRAFPDASGRRLLVGGQRVLLSDPTAEAGGPRPTPPFEALAVRQRILAAAAVHALSYAAGEPLVVSAPARWDPGVGWKAAGFFRGLDVPWLRDVGVTGLLRGTAFAPYAGSDPVYPEAERAAELPVASLAASAGLSRSGRTLAALLAGDDTIDELLAKSALLASSYRARSRPERAAALALRQTGDVQGVLRQVHIDGPTFVTMSGEEGTFQITVVNDLDQAVNVGIRARTGSEDLVIGSPDPISLGPGQRSSVRLVAEARNIGVHSVRLVPTTRDGTPLGNATEFSVRSSQVGLVIWLIMGAGAAVLVAAAGVRVVRRLRANASSGLAGRPRR